MLEFIAQYWLTFVFGFIASGLSVALSKVWKLYQNSKQEKIDEEKEEILQEVDKKLEQQNAKMIDADDEIKQEIIHLNEGLQTLTTGVLSVQGHGFREACRRLLKPEHTISIDEYEQICQDHFVYHELGGNHLGDQLFQSIERKFNQQMSPTE